MSLPQSFLDELRSRTTLSALVARSVKLSKSGREHKGCWPFHNEKTPSFTVNDEKAFAHCFGCGWHGEALRWLTDHDGLPVMDAVHQLASEAGMDVPARSPEAAAAAARIEGLRPCLEAAQEHYICSDLASGVASAALAARGIDDDTRIAFGLGYASPAKGLLPEVLNIGADSLVEAGLMVRPENGTRAVERFRDRITIPIHDQRGRIIGFGGRALGDGQPKYLNSPDSAIFDKGSVLFNLHRAAPIARRTRGMVVVEGYMDVIALTQLGIGEVVAPMGTALTERQLELIWRIDQRPILLFDGDKAGQDAAMRACIRALPHIGPDRSLHIATLPKGQDPDDLARSGGYDAVAAVLDAHKGLADFVFTRAAASVEGGSPEAIAGVWAKLDELARTIRDEEVRAQYLAQWRARYDREISSVDMAGKELALHALTRAEDAEYYWPEDENDSERRLIMIVQRGLQLRAQRQAITDDLRDLMSMAKAIGFDAKTINAAMRSIEQDPATRQDQEAMLVLYRRVLGIKGPMDEAMLPQLVDARARRVPTGKAKRLGQAMALVQAAEMAEI